MNLLKVVGSKNETEEFLSKVEKFGASLKVVETIEKYCKRYNCLNTLFKNCSI